MKWPVFIRKWLVSAPEKDGAVSDIADLIPKIIIPVLVIEADNESIPYYGDDASGDCLTPQQLLEVATFEHQMQTLGLEKVELDDCEIRELDFSRLDRVVTLFG